MTIILNGKPKELSCESGITVDRLVEFLELGPVPVLVELNGSALFPREMETAKVEDGDRVEIVQMVAGG